MLERTRRRTRYVAAVCLALLLLTFHSNLGQIQFIVVLCIVALLVYDLWWLAVVVVGVAWLWPDGVIDTPLVQLTLTAVIRLLAIVLLFFWGLANIYNRLGPLLVVWLVKSNAKRSAVNDNFGDNE
jgi:hypothetical protein